MLCVQAILDWDQMTKGNMHIGIIGGSGLYQMEGLQDVSEHRIDTPYGPTSDAIVSGQMQGVPVAFLARHGRQHSLIPAEVPYRANIWALKKLGVRYLISVSAVGSLQEDIAPLDMVLPDQFIDRTQGRSGSFFGSGAVAHVSMADPVCAALSGVLRQAHESRLGSQNRLHSGGTYLCIEGPTFSTRAESHDYRRMHASVVGMTNMPEAKLAREAEIAYATLALVTDYDCWNPNQACVTAELAIANLRLNSQRAQAVISGAIESLGHTPPASLAHDALRSSLVTPPSAMAAEVRQRLAPLLQKYM
jgi:5'-methylthioadenosine phosphorylase